MASDKRRPQPPPHNTSCKPALRPRPDAASTDFTPKPHHPPPEDEYGGGDIVSPEPPEPTEDDKPLP